MTMTFTNMNINADKILNDLDWDKMSGLMPAIVQDARTSVVLMLGYMNIAALTRTIESGWVTFFSRSKQQLWMKGETSGHKLQLVNVSIDCDRDTLLITANPQGPVCHQGTETCFVDVDQSDWMTICKLEETIAERALLSNQQVNDNNNNNDDVSNSYTATLFNAGISRIAQKVGEESVELILAAMENDIDNIREEAADLLFHYLVLLQAKQLKIADVIAVLKSRMVK